MSDDYARGVLSTAVSTLAGAGSIQERLDSAWLNIHTLSVQKLDNPQDQEIFEEIYHAASGGKALQMSNIEAQEYTVKIVDLLLTLLRNEVDELRDMVRKG